MSDAFPQPDEIPIADPPTKPPDRSRLLSEWAVVQQPMRLIARAGTLRRAPRGDGRLVVDLPGWLTGPESMVLLRRYLRSLGHDAVHWGLGRNGSDVEATIESFEPRLERLIEQRGGRKAHLVGWSLGGVIARETARSRPDLVERVVTMGTPAQGGPMFTAGASYYPRSELERIAALQAEANRTDPLTVPVTAVYTRRDAVVDWKACIDRWALDIRHVEVDSTHFGLGVDPDVWEIVAAALAADV